MTLNRVTVAFLLFSFFHCFAQGIIHSFIFSIDSEFAGLVTKVVHAAEIPLKNITYLEGSPNRYVLRMCDDIPHGQPKNPCMVIFRSGVDVHDAPGAEQSDDWESLSILEDLVNGFSLSTTRDSANNTVGVTFRSQTTEPVFLSQQCAQILVYPQQLLQNAAREDITHIFLQFWLFGVSAFVVAKSSVPHTLTVLGTRLLLTAWSTYIASYRTNLDENLFREMISAPGTPCGVEMFPTYFAMRHAYDIADVVLSCTALLLSGLLSWNLLKLYKAQSFNRVGAPAHITRIYKFFMAVEACLQLEVFVLVAATSLWSDILINTGIRDISAHTRTYYGVIIGTTVLLLPWIALGWYGVRRENKPTMVAFLGIAFAILAGWSIMFYSRVYRWSFIQWPYLGCLTVASLILIMRVVRYPVLEIQLTLSQRERNTGHRLLEELRHGPGPIPCVLSQPQCHASLRHPPVQAEAALASLNFAPEVFEHSDVEKSGGKLAYYDFDEPEYPPATFQFVSSHLRSDHESAPAGDVSPLPTPLRGPPPMYEKPYVARF
ncbi:hypothetical protein B0H15DRAFT_917641 [Mycena belliarum]|uniref:Uncharacterized protein n=1 Tax=Mycena belliarum TaxID=1033014 RepID=A0AAD6TNU0_9AGAR|nr:hypothetical protein B0H15DRAFT_917641 [Mycena belliae]